MTVEFDGMSRQPPVELPPIRMAPHAAIPQSKSVQMIGFQSGESTASRRIINEY